MKKKFQTVFSLLMVCVCLLSTVVPCFAAEGTVEDAPYVKNTSFLQVNAKENDSTVYADGYDHGYIPNIRTVQNSDGSYTVCVNETAKSSNQLRIVEFSAERQQLSSVVIPMELEMYVCFTKGTNNGKYYVLFANKEAKEKTDLIMRLVEYDTNGTKKRSLDFKGNAPASFNGINTIGCGNGDLYADDTLITGYVGRFMFPIPGDPNWHQSSYSFAVRTSDFVQIEKPSSAYIPYASHSFHQAIIPDGDSYLYVDRCDALPYRSFVFAKMKGVNWDLTTNCSVIYPEYPSPDDTKPKAHSFLFKGVEDGEGYYSNNTYSQYGGLIVLEDKYMLVGSYQNDETVLTESSANLFVQFLDKDTMSPIADPTYLTDWSDIEGQPPCYRTINNPKAVKISENRVAIIYSLCNKSFSSTQTRLMMIDASGKVLSDKAVESSVGDSLIVPRFGKVYYNQSKEAIEWFTVQNGTLIMRSIETKDPVAAKPFSQVSALYFQTQTLDLLIHESKQLLPNILPTTAGNRITWTSDNEAVITVDSMGTVIGIGNGTATVTATAPNGLAARISVSVTGGKPATGISVEFAKPEQETFTPSNAMAVQKGDYYGIYATVTPLDASNRTVSVSSTRPDVVYVAPNGTYWQAVGTGTAFLTVASYSDPDVKLTYRITVYAPGETPEIPDIYSSDEVISFGSYPQSFVADESMIAVLNRESNAFAWTSYGYYSGTGSADDGNMAPADYMKYKDFTYNGEKYRAVTFTSFRPTSTGKACSADTSVQDDNGFAENAVYFFKYEPLTWRVLDPKTGYMVCTKAIDSQAYQNYVYQSFNTQVAQISASDWETSSLKKWLNEDFYNAAFSDSEKEQIVAIKSLTSTSSTLVSLLSESDVLNGDYGYKTDAAASDTIRRMTATDYAKCQGVSVSVKDGTAAWWINAPKDEGNSVVVEADGSCMDGKAVSSTDIGVVPAVQINTNLESVVLERIELTLPKDLKSTYQIGETLNTDGIIVTAYYSNCSQKIVPLDECTISGWSSSAVGQKTIVVSYCGERASFTVTVEKSYSALVLVTKPTKLSYFVGQSLDLSGLAVAAKYTDQSTEPIDWNDCTISPFDPSKDGKQTITVTYLEKSVSFDVEVKKIELQSISISSYPTKRMYTTGESLDTSGLTLTLAYNDGSSKHITSGFTAQADLRTLGKKTVTVQYQGKSTSYEVTVELCDTTIINILGYCESRTEEYKASVILHYEAVDIYEGSTVHWFVNGNDEGTADTYRKDKITAAYSVQIKLIASDGQTVLQESGVEHIKVKNGVFDRFFAIFKGWFHALPIIDQK